VALTSLRHVQEREAEHAQSKLTVTAAHAGKELQRLAVVGWWWQLPRSKQGASQQRQLAVVVQARTDDHGSMLRAGLAISRG
jgi:hypothetical protein